MGRIATDVALLPDEGMTEWAIGISRKLVREQDSEIVLGRETCLPHISLAMGCIDENDLDAIQELLQKLAAQTTLGQLNATGIHVSTNSRGGSTSLLEIERIEPLQSLHEKVMRETEPLFSQDADASMFLDDSVADSTLEWVRSYPQKAAFENFSPHITLGYGRAQTDESFPIPFTASSLALCHVGNHGTCRKVLIAGSTE